MLNSAISLKRQFVQKFRYKLEPCFMKGHSCCGACSDKSFYLFPQYTFIQYNFYKSLEVLYTKTICSIKGQTASSDIEIDFSTKVLKDSPQSFSPIFCRTLLDDCQCRLFYIIYIICTI